MPRFVLLQHDAPQGTHFDFMLESGGMLRTWSLPQLPKKDAAFDCEAIADHRLAYLEYEGPISDGRGAVVQYDAGEYTTIRQDDAEWTVELKGRKLLGRVVLQHASAAANLWNFSFAEK